MKNFIKYASVAGGTMALMATVAAQAQVIDTLTGSLGGYTTTLVNDGGSGGASSVSFTDSASGLQANFVGTVADPEQALFLAPVSSFATSFVVGDILTVNTAVPASTIQEDFGLAVSATATPPAAGANASTRANFDWASVSIRPSQTAIRNNSSVSGTLTTGANVLTAAPNTVTQLFIEWNSADVFTLGYFSGGAQVTSEQVTFNSGSTIGTAIGFYGDIRDAGGGTTLGNFSNLEVGVIPEPGTASLLGLGGLVSAFCLRRKK
jgi:hypothetical protein